MSRVSLNTQDNLIKCYMIYMYQLINAPHHEKIVIRYKIPLLGWGEPNLLLVSCDQENSYCIVCLGDNSMQCFIVQEIGPFYKGTDKAKNPFRDGTDEIKLNQLKVQ